MFDKTVILILLLIWTFFWMYNKHRVELFENVELSLRAVNEVKTDSANVTAGSNWPALDVNIPAPVFEPQYTQVTSFTPNIEKSVPMRVAVGEKGMVAEYYTQFTDLDHPGSDLNCRVYDGVTTAAQCGVDCAKDSFCRGFVDVRKGTNSVIPQGFCCTKRIIGDAIETKGVMSYIK